jgi:hypothetical protein
MFYVAYMVAEQLISKKIHYLNPVLNKTWQMV